jgi:hypothetical protein
LTSGRFFAAIDSFITLLSFRERHPFTSTQPRQSTDDLWADLIRLTWIVAKYLSPLNSSDSNKVRDSNPLQIEVPEAKNYGCRGAVAGGCLFPILIFIFAAISGDMGGPLFWPFLVVVFGIVGLVVGLFIPRKPKSRSPNEESPSTT